MKWMTNLGCLAISKLFVLFLCDSAFCFIDDSPKPIIIYSEPDFPKVYYKLPEVTKKKPNMTCGVLGIDETCIMVKSNLKDHTVKFLFASMECDKCSLQERNPIKPGASDRVILKFASLGTVWKVVDEENISLCSGQSYLGENSWYHIDVNHSNCSLVCDKEPETTFYPLIIAVGIYFLFAVLWSLAMYLKREAGNIHEEKQNRKEILNSLFARNSVDISTEDLNDVYSSSNSSEKKTPKATQKRLKSLDTVRGIAIVIMIFVNYGGGKYWYFHHSRWNGLTIADLVFPWFMWMMGMSMALSLRSLLRKSVSRRKIFLKIVKRSIILFSLGIMLNTYCSTVNLNDLRIPGVLQRFSVTYFIVATIHLCYASPQDDQKSSGFLSSIFLFFTLRGWQASSSSLFRDITPYSVEWLIMCTLLTSHVLLTFLVHSPDCPPGYLGPGGNHAGGNYSQCTGGAAGYIDRMILGNNHIYNHPTFKEIYRSTLPYDPEGILGFLTSIFLVFLGLQAGKILLMYKESKDRLIRWMIWSALTGVIAAVLCLCSKNDGYIPVNKNLWSVSFIMATGSLAFALMSVCYIVIDVKQWWSGAPFFYAGMNSILLYVGHEITHQMFPWNWGGEATHMYQLFQDLWGTTLWVLIAIYMFHKNFFLAI